MRAGVSVARHHVWRCGGLHLVGDEARAGSACVPRFRGAQHVHRRRLPQEGHASRARRRGTRVREPRTMATMAPPTPPRMQDVAPNIPRAGVRLPAVRDYAQIDREVTAVLHPTLAWFGALCVAIVCLGIGIFAWMYQIYSGLGVAGYHPPVMWGVYIVSFVFCVGIDHPGTMISAQ